MNRLKLNLIITLSLLSATTLFCLSGGTDWQNFDEIDIYTTDMEDYLKTDLDELIEKAMEYYDDGDYESAAQYFIFLLRYNIKDSTSIYNLACCYGLLGEAELSAKYLKRAVITGFDNLEFIIDDRDFDKVRDEDVFQTAFKSMKFHIERMRWIEGEPLYVEGPSLHQCRVHLPEDFDAEKTYPLVVALHGFSGNPGNFDKTYERFNHQGFIFTVPTAPYPVALGEDFGHSWLIYPPVEEKLMFLSTEATENYIANVVNHLTSIYNVDGVFLMGLSQGCFFTYNAGIKHHELFEGLICCSGWLDREWLKDEQIEAANHLRVYISHGKKDSSIDFDEAISAKNTLSDFNYNVTFYEFDGGHYIPDEVLPDVIEWMGLGVE